MNRPAWIPRRQEGQCPECGSRLFTDGQNIWCLRCEYFTDAPEDGAKED